MTRRRHSVILMVTGVTLAHLVAMATPIEFLEHGQLHHGDNYEAVVIPAEMEARPMHKSELTFTLADGEHTCFTDDFTDSSNYTFQYKVLGEGQVVDANMVSPHGIHLYTAYQSKGDSTTFLSYPGIFTFCITNQFYTFTTKIVYIRLQRTSALNMGMLHGDRSPMMLGPKEASTQIIFEELEKVNLHQITYRLKERIASKNAEDLLEKVNFVSVFNAVALMLAGLGQTYFLKRLFKNSKTRI